MRLPQSKASAPKSPGAPLYVASPMASKSPKWQEKLRLPKSKASAPKSPGTPLYFASPMASMTPTPKWQEKLKLKSKLKNEWKAAPPVFAKQGISKQRWSITDEDTETEATDSIYGSKSDLEFSDNEEQVAKSAYKKATSETKRALLMATRNSETSAHRFQRGGSQRGSFYVEGLDVNIHDSVTSIDFVPGEDDLAAYVYQKSREGTNKNEKKSNNGKNVTPGRGSIRARMSLFEAGSKEETKVEIDEVESKEEQKEEPKPRVFRREGGSQRVLVIDEDDDPDLATFHGSKTQIEYIADEDDIAKYIYEKAQKTAERVGGKPKLEKRMSGYNFTALLLEEES